MTIAPAAYSSRLLRGVSPSPSQRYNEINKIPSRKMPSTQVVASLPGDSDGDISSLEPCVRPVAKALRTEMTATALCDDTALAPLMFQPALLATASKLAQALPRAWCSCDNKAATGTFLASHPGPTNFPCLQKSSASRNCGLPLELKLQTSVYFALPPLAFIAREAANLGKLAYRAWRLWAPPFPSGMSQDQHIFICLF